jgi:hypothetical protein
MKVFKFSAAFTAALSMAIAPLAQGAEAKATAKAYAEAKARAAATTVNYNVDTKAVQEFLKLTGLNTNKRMTVGEFHFKMRPYYPRTLRAQMDEWARMNRNEIMPEFQASTYKDNEGKERVRLMMTKDGQTITASFNPDDNAKFVKVNNVFLTKDDIKYHEQAIRKIVHGNKPIKDQMNKTKPKNQFKTSILLGYEEYSRLTAVERATYLVKVRYVLENAERVMASYYGNQAVNEMKKEFFVQWLLLEQAEAAGSKSIRGAQPGDPCVVAGYLATYGNDYSCGGTGPGRAKLIQEMNQWGGGRCTNGSVSCNPLVYGFNSNGSAICVKNAGKTSEIYSSTSQACPKASPLRKGTADEQADKKRIIESYLAQKDPELLKKLGKDGLAFKDGKVSKEQYDLIAKHLSDLNTYIDKATTACSVAPLSEIQKVREEQQSACQALALRKIELDSYPTSVVLLPAPIPPTVSTCGEGGTPRNSESVNGKCVCRAGDEVGSITEDGKTVPACIAIAPVIDRGDDAKDECNKDQQPNPNAKEGEDSCKKAAGACTWCKWLIGGLVFAGVAGLVWWMTRDKDKDHKATTDPDPCPPAPLICSPVTPVTNPPSSTEPSSQPPPIQPPPVVDPNPIPPPAVTPFVESTTGATTSTSGGVR